MLKKIKLKRFYEANILKKKKRSKMAELARSEGKIDELVKEN